MLKVTLGPSKEVEFADETLVQMGESILRTKKAERGFALCYSGNQILPGKEHVGGRSSISYKDCGRAPKAGSFHTHPRDGDSEPSWYDGFGSLHNGWSRSVQWITCTGSPKDMTVRCHAPRDVPDGLTVKVIGKDKRKMHGKPMSADKRFDELHQELARFRVRDLPKLVSRDILPRAGIRVEDVSFAGSKGPSKYRKYINADTGEVISVEPIDQGT